jgi:hypothetical protein
MKLMNLNSEDTLNLVTTSNPLRYGGKSSGFFLLQKAQAAKDNYMEEMKLAEGDNFGQGMGNNQVKRRPEFWRFYPVSIGLISVCTLFTPSPLFLINR